MKKVFILAALVAGVCLYSCGGNNSSENNTGESAATNETTSSSAVDPDKPSLDDKGVGEFTQVTIGNTIDPQLADKGKEIFQMKCTVCHQPTSQKLIGPGLKGITQLRSPEWIMNMITNPDKMLESDPVAKALLEQYNQVRMTNQGVDKDGARALYEFLRQNDAQ